MIMHQIKIFKIMYPKIFNHIPKFSQNYQQDCLNVITVITVPMCFLIYLIKTRPKLYDHDNFHIEWYVSYHNMWFDFEFRNEMKIRRFLSKIDHFL